MIDRLKFLDRVKTGLRRSPVVALIGPRQCGKTTLARQVLARESPLYFDLEDPVVAAAFENPMSSLAPLRGIEMLYLSKRFDISQLKKLEVEPRELVGA